MIFPVTKRIFLPFFVLIFSSRIKDIKSATEPNLITEGDHPTNAGNDNSNHLPSTDVPHTSAVGNATVVPDTVIAETAPSSLVSKLDTETMSKQQNNESLIEDPDSSEDSMMTDSAPTSTETNPSTNHGHLEPHYVKSPAIRRINQASALPSLDMNRIRRLSRNRSFFTAGAGSTRETAMQLGSPTAVQEGSPKQYSAIRVSRQSSFNERCKKFFTTDSSWPWIHQIKSQNRLNVYCSYVIMGSGYGFLLVNDADIFENARLRLDQDTIVDADIVNFTASDSLGKMYFTKGFRADCVFAVHAYDPKENIFTLKEHLCNIAIPTPTTTPEESLQSSPKQRSPASASPLTAIQSPKSTGDVTPELISATTQPGAPNPFSTGISKLSAPSISLEARLPSTEIENPGSGSQMTPVGIQTLSLAPPPTKAPEVSTAKQTMEFSASTSTPPQIRETSP